MKNYNLGERLKAIRKHCGKNQWQFAEMLGISRSSLQDYEKGKGVPSIDTLIAYHERGNMSWNYLLVGKEENNDFKLLHLIKALSPEMRDQMIRTIQTIVENQRAQ